MISLRNAVIASAVQTYLERQEAHDVKKTVAEWDGKTGHVRVQADYVDGTGSSGAVDVFEAWGRWQDFEIERHNPPGVITLTREDWKIVVGGTSLMITAKLEMWFGDMKMADYYFEGTPLHVVESIHKTVQG